MSIPRARFALTGPSHPFAHLWPPSSSPPRPFLFARGALWLALFALLVTTGCEPFVGPGDFLNDGEGDDDPAGAVFVMTNDPDGNTVATFDRAADGTLMPAGTFATGGSGANITGSDDPLATQDHLILSDDRSLLFAVNAGSDEVSSFSVDGSALELRDTRSSGGSTPVALTQHRNLLFVANTGDGGSVSGFRIEDDGKLTPLEGATQSLEDIGVIAPGTIQFAPSGNRLYVTGKASDNIAVFPVTGRGVLGTPTVVASTGTTPFGGEVTRNGVFIVSNAAAPGGPPAEPGASTVTSYRFGGANGLRVISPEVPTNQTAACWVELTPNDRYAYTSNTPDGTLSGFRVARNGRLTAIDDGITGTVEPGAFVLDAAITGDGFLYVVSGALGTVSVFEVEANGQLTRRADADQGGFVAGEFTGLAAF